MAPSRPAGTSTRLGSEGTENRAPSGGNAQPVKRVDRPLRFSGRIDKPPPHRETVIPAVGKQRLRLGDPLYKPSLKKPRIALPKAAVSQPRARRASGISARARNDEPLNRFAPNRGTGQRKGRDEGVRPSAATTPHPQNRNGQTVVVLPVHPVAGETSVQPAAGTTTLAKLLPPPSFYPLNAIVTYRNVD